MRIVWILIAALLTTLVPGVGAFDLVSIESEGSVAISGGVLTGPQADFTAVFDGSPAGRTIVFVFVTSSGNIERAPNTCDERSCTVGPVPLKAIGAEELYVRTNTESWYEDDRIIVRVDDEGPRLTTLEVTTGASSSVSFESEDESGSGSYRLMRDGATISYGEELSATVELDEPINPADEVRFALSLTDAFGNVRSEVFGGRVPEEPASIDSIANQAYLDGDGRGIVLFEVSGVIDHVEALVSGSEHHASCISGSCVAFIDSPGSSEAVTIRISDPFGSTASRTATVSFVTDTVAPIFDRFTTRYRSYDDMVGYTHGEVFIDFIENAMMYPEDVIVSIGDRRTSAHSCERIGSIVRCAIPMSTAGTIEFRSATDASGNEATVPSGALTSRTIALDTRTPRILQLAVLSDAGSSVADTVTIGSAGEIRIILQLVAEGSQANRADVSVRSSSGTRTVQLDFECEMLAGAGSDARCISDPLTIDETSRLAIEVYDASGSAYRADRLIEIGGLSVPGASRWDVIDVTPIPGYYLTGALLPVTIEARIGSRALSESQSIGGARLVSCDGIEGGLASVDGRVVVITGFSDGSQLESGTGSCSVALTTIRGGALDPQPEEVEIRFVLAPIASAGIEDPLTNYERGSSIAKTDALLTTAQQAFEYADVACLAYDTMNNASLAINLLAVTTRPIPPVHTALALAGGVAFSTVDELGPIADPLCAVAHCKIPLEWFGGEEDTTLQDAVLGWYHGIEGDGRSWINSELGFSVVSEEQSVQRVEDSIALSMLTMCIPGVIDNMRDYTQVQCAHDLCMLQVHTGDFPGTASMCQRAHAMRVCSEIVGEGLALVPYGTIYSEIAGQISDIIRQPLKLIANWALDAFVDAIADVSPEVRAALNQQLLTAIQDVTGTSAPTIDVPTDYCSELNEYIEELDERGVFG
jgi:hypothetical protein